jgi:4-alpha-glucanotransferase
VSDVPEPLRALARELGIATQFWDWRGKRVETSDETLRAVLAAFDVDTAGEAQLRAALDELQADEWLRVLPSYVTARTGHPMTVPVHAGEDERVRVSVLFADGSRRRIQPGQPTERRRVLGRSYVARAAQLPRTLPVGYHRISARAGDRECTCELIVAPAWLGLPVQAGAQPAWGLAAQLYSVRSRRSWGVGDLADLADLAAWAGAEHGAGFVLVNPLLAAEPVAPMEPSPYLPTTRRYPNPIYLRPERIPEYADLPDADRVAVTELAAGAGTDRSQIDRDAAWSAKRAALEIVYRAGRTPGREIAFRAYCRRERAALDKFAAWCALAEEHGADWSMWPADLRHPGAAGVAAFATEHGARLDFYRWLQWLLDEQLAGAQHTARSCGMPIGIMHDLAVGVSGTGADSWAYQDELAGDITVGAPPDAYAQTGQDWQQPPWRPDRLAALGYAPLREIIGSVLRHAGGLRVDHIIGLFRLWWIPQGMSPTQGTYVHYDHDAAIAILMIEAVRAGAVVVGEDLGTVQPWVRDYLRERGILGTSLLWFERDWDGDGAPIPPERWQEYSLASVTTHDLPPTPAYLAGDHVRLRHELGLLTRPLDEELAAERADRDAWLTLLRDRGLLAPQADEATTIEALHRALLDTPARLRCLALTDAVGERRTQNQPGTRNEYPNWRVPLGGPDGQPLHLEDVFTSARVAKLADLMNGS